MDASMESGIWPLLADHGERWEKLSQSFSESDLIIHLPPPPHSECSPQHTRGLHDVFPSRGTSPSPFATRKPCRKYFSSSSPGAGSVLGWICAVSNSARATPNPESFRPSSCPMGKSRLEYWHWICPGTEHSLLSGFYRINNLYTGSKASYMKNGRTVRLISYYSGLISNFQLCCIWLPFFSFC